MSKKKEDKQKNKKLWIYCISLMVALILLIGFTVFYMKDKDKKDEKEQ